MSADADEGAKRWKKIKAKKSIKFSWKRFSVVAVRFGKPSNEFASNVNWIFANVFCHFKTRISFRIFQSWVCLLLRPVETMWSCDPSIDLHFRINKYQFCGAIRRDGNGNEINAEHTIRLGIWECGEEDISAKWNGDFICFPPPQTLTWAIISQFLGLPQSADNHLRNY